MTQAALKPSCSFAEFVQLEKTSATKHQLMQGEVFDMAGGTPERAALILRVGSKLDPQLDGTPCRAFSSDLRVRAGELTTYPDVTVVCGRLDRDPDDTDTIRNPAVVIEVLSDSTEAFDRGRKFEQYRSVPSLREYVLVRQNEPHIEVYTRGDDAWTLREARKGQTIAVVSIGCVLEVDAVYSGVLEAREAALTPPVAATES